MKELAANQQSDRNTKGLKSITKVKIRTLLRSVESERTNKFNLKRDTLYHTPLNYFEIEVFDPRIDLAENLSIELESSVRLKLGTYMI